MADAMGNVVTHGAQRKDIEQQSMESDTNVYVPTTGRLAGTESGTSETLITYSPGGDRTEVNQVNGAIPEETFGGLDDARYYYRADGLLAAVDHRVCGFILFPSAHCVSDSVSLSGSFEDYRYDALGRRVLVRTRTENVCTGSNCHSALMWVAWDGSQIAEEVRGAGSNTLSDDSLELGLPPGDAAQRPFYGTVVYLNGPTVDQPLEIQGIIPYRTWRGVIDSGSCGGCSQIDFPGRTYEAYLAARLTKIQAPRSWHGTLFAAGLDDSGLMYRRNRYYDPATGQFTQEDPLGLAGGMNAYGFGNGDPVNHSDPFGLCPWILNSKAPCELIAAAFSEINPKYGREEARALAHAIINRAHDPVKNRYGHRNTGNLDADIVGQVKSPNQVQGVGNSQYAKAMRLFSGEPEQFDPGSSAKLTAAYLGVEQAYSESTDPTGGATFWDHPPSRPGQGASKSSCAPVSTGTTGSMSTAKCSKP